MALNLRGFILMPQFPACKSYPVQAMIMLPTPHPNRMHARNISHSVVCRANREPGVTKGGGGQINKTASLREENVSDHLSSSNTDQKDGKKSKEDNISATPNKTGASAT